MVKNQKENRNGYEVWRVLIADMEPRSDARALALLYGVIEANILKTSALNNFQENLMKWEEAIAEYDSTASEQFPTSIKRAIVFHNAPQELAVHLQIHAASLQEYSQVREVILAFLKAKVMWSAATGSNDGVVPMDIGGVDKGKGKGKGKGKADC